MTTLLRLAFIEWRRGFPWQPGGGSGKRDFSRLTALLTLTLLLASLLWGTKEGVLHRFMDVSLGYVPSYGVPIWLVTEVDGADNKGVTHTNHQAVQQTIHGISLYPYREITSGDLNLPSSPGQSTTSPVWKATTQSTDFTGWVVDTNDPLWLGNAGPIPPTPGLALSLVLNAREFGTHFQCDAYRAALATVPGITLPPPVTGKVHPQADCLANGILWLQARPGMVSRFLPFKIRWQPRILTMGAVALLIPRSTYQVIKLASYNPGLRYYPQAPDQPQRWIKILMVWDMANNPTTIANSQAVADCLGGEWLPDKSQIVLNFPRPLPDVITCADQNQLWLKDGQSPVTNAPTPPHGAYLTIADELPGHAIKLAANGDLIAPCDPLHQAFKTQVACSTEIGQFAMEKVLAGDQFAMAYVQDSSQLFPVLEQLRSFPNPDAPDHRPLFTIHAIYADAITKFGFIKSVMEQIELVYTVFFGAFLTALAWIQISLVIGHRRKNYGLLLAKGFSWLSIRSMVLAQITFSVLTAWVFSEIIFWILQTWLSTQLQGLLANANYQAHLAVSDLDLLSLPLIAHIETATVVLVVCILIALMQLHRPALSNIDEPAYLLAG